MADNSQRSLARRVMTRFGTAAYVVACSALIVTSRLIPSETLGVALQSLVGLVAAGSLVMGARRTQRVGTNPWLCTAAGVAFVVCGTTVGSFTRIAGGGRPTWADAIYFLGYATLGLGFLVFARVRSDATSRTAMLDGCVIAIAVTMLLWIAFIAPDLAPRMRIAHRLTLAASPIRDGILVAILAWITLAPGRRSPALQLLAAGTALMLAADLAADLALTLNLDWSRGLAPVSTLAVAIFGLAGRYAPHSLRDPATIDSDTTERVSRSVLLGVALLIGPLATIVGDVSTIDGVVMIAGCSMLLAIGVVARFVDLVHHNQRIHAATTTSERRFRLLADSAPVGIFEFARGMRVTYANPEGLRLLGSHVLGGSTSEMLDRVEPDSQPALLEAIACLESGEPGSAELKLKGSTRDRWVTFQGVPIKVSGPQLPMAFASTLDITRLKQAESALARQATHDPLTGLPNRRLLIEALIQGLANLGRGQRTGTVALMFVDLDQFKMVNDVLGHDAGDALLKTAAARLRNAVREHDIVARFGGDEFVVLLEHVSDRGELHDVAQRILRALEVPIQVAGTEAQVGASVGIATASGPDDDPDALVRNADAAMYKAKEHGRGRYEFFRPDISENAHRTL